MCILPALLLCVCGGEIERRLVIQVLLKVTRIELRRECGVILRVGVGVWVRGAGVFSYLSFLALKTTCE